MAIGTAAAIGLGAAAIGGAISSSSNKKAAGKAADASVAAAKENSALAREMYGKNEGYLSPYIQSGQVAGSYLNAFLGLPTQQPAPQASFSPAPQQSALSGSTSPFGYAASAILGGQMPSSGAQGVDWSAYVRSNPDALANWEAIKNTSDGKRFGGDMAAFGQFHYNDDGARRDLTPYMPKATQQAPQAPAVTTADAQSAFGNYLKTSDYGFQFATGTNAVNSGYAGNGTLLSGAAMKGIEQFRQNLQAGYRNEYMSALGNQQGVGLSAGSALAGVGQNYVNTISANNNNSANAAGNAALIKGQNNPFANALGTIGGGLIGYGR